MGTNYSSEGEFATRITHQIKIYQIDASGNKLSPIPIEKGKVFDDNAQFDIDKVPILCPPKYHMRYYKHWLIKYNKTFSIDLIDIVLSYCGGQLNKYDTFKHSNAYSIIMENLCILQNNLHEMNENNIQLFTPSNYPYKKYKILSPGFNKIIDTKIRSIDIVKKFCLNFDHWRSVWFYRYELMEILREYNYDETKYSCHIYGELDCISLNIKQPIYVYIKFIYQNFGKDEIMTFNIYDDIDQFWKYAMENWSQWNTDCIKCDKSSSCKIM